MNTTTQPTARTEAIAWADAHLNNAGLPTYSEMLEVMRDARLLMNHHGVAKTRTVQRMDEIFDATGTPV